MSYTHITIEERESIQMMLVQGKTQESISEFLNRSKSSISREISRNSVNGNYSTIRAEKLSKERKKDVEQ